MSCFEAEYSTPTWASTLILFCVLHRKKMLTDANAGLRPRNDVWYLCCTCNLLLYAFIFIWPDYTDVEPFCLQRKAAITNEWGIFCMFYSMSTSDQPALIEQNKLNLRGSDASPSLSVWISLSLIRSGSRPVPVVSVEVEKVGTIYGEANLTNLTASLSAPTAPDG